MPSATPWNPSCKKSVIDAPVTKIGDPVRARGGCRAPGHRSEAVVRAPRLRSVAGVEVSDRLELAVRRDGVHPRGVADDRVAVAEVHRGGDALVVDVEVLERSGHALAGEVLVVAGLLEGGDGGVTEEPAADREVARRRVRRVLLVRRLEGRDAGHVVAERAVAGRDVELVEQALERLGQAREPGTRRRDPRRLVAELGGGADEAGG